jgi:4-amino-4-deoxy-L-arabinose transferase-like glycosyltransferase
VFLTSRTRSSLAAILAVAAALRIAWAVYAARAPSASLHDPNFYLLYGEQIARGHGYVIPYDQGPTAYYPVGYPIVLAIVNFVLIHTVGDHPVGAAAAINVVFGVAAVALVFAIGRQLGGDAVGLVAAGITALYPNLVYHTAVALTETVFNAFFLLILLVVVKGPWAEGRFERRRLISLGVLVGVCVLIRPVAAPLVGALLVAWLIAGFGWRRSVAQAAVVVGVAMLVVSPWIVRNIRVMHSATLSTNTGDNFCMSRHLGATGTFDFTDNPCFQGLEDLHRPEFETVRDSRNRRLAVNFVQDHPLEEVKLWGSRLYRTFNSDWDGVWAVESYGDKPFLSGWARDALRWAGSAYFFATVALAGAGAVIVVRRRDQRDARWALLPLSIIATVVVPVVATFGDTRFHVPALPLMAIGAAVPVVAARDLLLRRA